LSNSCLGSMSTQQKNGYISNCAHCGCQPDQARISFHFNRAFHVFQIQVSV
jgi:hypothetical protein